METSESAATAAAEEARLERELALARESGEWRPEVDAAGELLMFYMGSGSVLGIDEIAPKLERLAEEMRAQIGFGARLRPRSRRRGRASGARTLAARHRRGRAVVPYLRRVRAVQGGDRSGGTRGREGDFARAGEQAAVAEAARRQLMESTEGPTEGWPDELRASRAALRERVAGSAAAQQQRAPGAGSRGPDGRAAPPPGRREAEARPGPARGRRGEAAGRRDPSRSVDRIAEATCREPRRARARPRRPEGARARRAQLRTYGVPASDERRPVRAVRAGVARPPPYRSRRRRSTGRRRAPRSTPQARARPSSAPSSSSSAGRSWAWR